MNTATRPSATPPASGPHQLLSSSPSTPQANAAMPASTSTKPARGTTATGSGPPPASRSSLKPIEGERPTRPSSKDSLKQKMAKKAEDPPKPNNSEETLKTLKTLKGDFDNLRAHITCKICDRLLYEPYTISCGHTYCYSCLCQWFVGNKSRKTCPDCRSLVTQVPAPAYLIRDMTCIFTSRTELLPNGETIEQHSKWAKEEADIVQQDKSNQDVRTGGLFKGCFRPRTTVGGDISHVLRSVRDDEDGVDRCPLCHWELEDGECTQCGLYTDENGALTYGDGFSGFSDVDESDEVDMSGEDYDQDMDMEDAQQEFDGYDDSLDDWGEYGLHPHETSFQLERFLEAAAFPNRPGIGNRRRMTHSEAGSRRSYSQSIVSDMYTDEMDTVEEEDEEGEDEDSSMNDFIDDTEVEPSASPSPSPSASATPGRTPQPTSGLRGIRTGARRVVASETSSTTSGIPEEDEDEEDEGPIRRGRRNRAHSRILDRANGSRAPPSQASTDVSIEQDDEALQALLGADGWERHVDEEMEGDDDDDSDGARTAVDDGWGATAISNDRLRMGGSLTPTADRPRPNASDRPPRAGASRLPDGSRGLRRRSSVLSTSTVHYEDGEADDDDSDPNGDGDVDVTRALNTLQRRRSRAQIQQRPGSFGDPNNRFSNRGFSQGDAVDLDTDDNSDTSQQPTRRQGSSSQNIAQHYDPRISYLFADHQRVLHDLQRVGAMMEHEMRSTTPVARPRTANRNRASPAAAFSPFMPPGNAPSRLRTPMMNASSNPEVGARVPHSSSTRGNSLPGVSSASGAEHTRRLDRALSMGNGTTNLIPISPPRVPPQSSVNAISQAQAAAAVDLIDRPPSRVTARPPSAAGRRGTAAYPTAYPGLAASVGLGFGNRVFQAPQGSQPGNQQRNPWGHFLQPRVRNRNSRTVLREQSSTATLRPANSRANLRDTAAPAPGMRPQASRTHLRHQPSQRRLNPQTSTRTLRAADHNRAPPSPSMNVSVPDSSGNRPLRSNLNQDEIARRGRELANNRATELLNSNPPGTASQRTNPFTSRFPRTNVSHRDELAIAGEMLTTAAANPPNHVRTNSSESLISIGSSNTMPMAPSSPGLSRRRSSRNMASAPPGTFPTAQATFQSAPPAYPNAYLRARSGSLSSNSAMNSPLATTQRGLSPLIAAGDSGLL